jgi:hypothetical protein
VQFATTAPHIFAWLNLHTFGGVFVRPPFSDSEREITREDLKHYAYAAGLVAEHASMPTIGALAEMTLDSTKPMTGTLAAWAYTERGQRSLFSKEPGLTRHCANLDSKWKR